MSGRPSSSRSTIARPRPLPATAAIPDSRLTSVKVPSPSLRKGRSGSATCAVAVVAVEAGGVLMLRRLDRNWRPLRQEKVEPAVAVVIDHADAAAHRLDQAEAAVGGLEVGDGEPGGRGNIDETECAGRGCRR